MSGSATLLFGQIMSRRPGGAPEEAGPGTGGAVFLAVFFNQHEEAGWTAPPAHW